MAGLDASAASDVLKNDYQDPLREQLNNSHILLTRVRKESKNFVGAKAILALHKGRNVGVGARAEGGSLPTAGTQQYDQAEFTPVYIYGSILLNGPTIAAMKSNKGAFIRAIQSETKGLAIDMKQDVQRQVWRDGSAFLTQCGVTSASTTVNVNSTKYIEPGMLIDIRVRASGAGVHATAAQQAVVTVPSSTTFTVGSAVTTAATDAVLRRNVRATATGTTDPGTEWDSPDELWGLEAIVSNKNPGFGLDGTDNAALTSKFGTIDRATETIWQSKVLRNGGTLRSLSLDLMQQAVDETDIAADVIPGLILTSHAIKRRYAGLLQADKRYPEGGEITLDGGYRALEFNGIPLVADKDAGTAMDPSKLERLYFLTMGSLEWEVLEDFQWMQEDGAVLARVSGKDQYEATMYAYLQLAAEQCNSHCVLADIDEAA